MRNFFLVVDTETTGGAKNAAHVVDFGAAICDKSGKVYNQCSVLIEGIYTDKENYPLFSFKSDGIWDFSTLPARYARYDAMLKTGARMLASVSAVNRWLARAVSAYRPVLTAYNLEFDSRHCRTTGIDLDMFQRRFCLMRAAQSTFSGTRPYRQHVLDSLAFNRPTPNGNMSFRTDAETMARFALGNIDLPDEPHTALEDVLDYEIPVLVKLARKHSVKKLCSTDWRQLPWQDVQVKKWFKPI